MLLVGCHASHAVGVPSEHRCLGWAARSLALGFAFCC